MGGVCSFFRYVPFYNRLLLTKFEESYENYGRFVARNPWKFISGALILVFLLGLGLLNLKFESEVEKLFVPENSIAEKALKDSKPHFINLLNSREQAIIFHGKSHSSLFNKRCLKKANDLLFKIMTEKDFRGHCYKKPSYFNRSIQYDASQPCFLVNPLELILNFSSADMFMKQAVHDTSKVMSNGRTASENQYLMFDKQGLLTNSLRTILYVKEYQQGSNDKEDVLKWEKSFIKFLKSESEQQHLKECFSLKFSSRRSLDDAILESGSADTYLVSIGFALMITFARLAMGSFINPVKGHATLSNAAILSIAFGILSGFGFVVLVGVPFMNLVGILPFLVLGIGIDDMFIITNEFDAQDSVKNPALQVGSTMAKIGATITMTTLTDIVAFLVSSSTAFPAIKYFCIFAAVTFTAEFLLQMTFFLACLVFESRRVNASRRDCLPFWRGKNQQVCCMNVKGDINYRLMGWYAEKLLTKPGKAIGICASLVLLALGLYGCLNVDDSFDRRTLIIKDSYLRNYLDTFEQDFHQTIAVNLALTKQVNYHSQKIMNDFISASKLATDTSFYEAKSSSWVADFAAWKRAQNTSRKFGEEIQTFLSIPKHGKYYEDLRFDKDRNIIASQIQVFMKSSTDSRFHKDAMLQLRDALEKNNIDLVPTADNFIYFEQYAAVTSEVIQSICIASVVILFITSPFCVHYSISGLLLLGFGLLVVELFGVMHFFNVSLNSVSMINLVMSIGFAVDYSAHIAYAFVTSMKGSTHDKVVDALSTVGASVLLGGASTFLGMLPTAFATSDIFKIFFKMFMGIIIIGLFNGLVLLPILFSLMGPLLKEGTKDPLKKKKRQKERKDDCTPLQKKENSSLSVAIVGLSTRFPSANNKKQFWELLREGRNTLCDYPKDRGGAQKEFERLFNPTRTVKGRSYAILGSYLGNVSMFDNNFFGISKTEATMMDPQQRLLLKGVIEAIEDAGITLKELQSVNTGVYVGAMNFEFEAVFSNNYIVNQFTGTGTSGSIIANRISFALNLRGPSITVDTACSSSLSALNVAFEHLRSGKCDIAIVGSANVIVDHSKQVVLCQANMLAPDGQSKAFDERCDGYGRGEGAVVIVLKQIRATETDDKSIYCKILACNINNDGQSAIPITAPSVAGQTKLFNATCMDAGIDPEQLSYLEAHGTGTVIGDLVETQSISQAYCARRTFDNPLEIGSIKSNINHTESTAGLAGIAKVCLMIENKMLVPTVGIRKFNPKLELAHKSLHVGQTCKEWIAPNNVPRRAAINSFGFGGSNAHVIVEEACPVDDQRIKRKGLDKLQKRMMLMILSAKSKSALSEQAMVFSYWLASQQEDQKFILDLCYSLACRRTMYNHRLCVSFSTIEEAFKRLSHFGQGMFKEEHSISYNRVKPTTPKIGLLFGGQGSDWMGMQQYFSAREDFKIFMNEVEIAISNSEIAKELSKYLSESNSIDSSREVQFRGSQVPQNATRGINELTKLQLSIFKVQYAIAKVLIEKCNITPIAVAGHSLGDVAAACISGGINLRNAVDLIIIRSELQNTCRSDGKMAAVGISIAQAKERFQNLQLEDSLQIAASNDLQNITISGDEASVNKFLHDLDAFQKLLPTAKAYHSHHMDSIQSLFWQYATRIKFKSKWSSIQFVSSVYGKAMSGKELNAAYWWDNVREPVNFRGAVEVMKDMGCQALVEISPRPVLKTYLQNICSAQNRNNTENGLEVLTAMPSGRVEAKMEHFYARCIGQLLNLGCPVDLHELLGFEGADFTRCPTYAWQETELWPESHETNISTNYLSGPWQGTQSDGSEVFQNEIDLHRYAFLEDHQLRDVGPVFPGAGYIEIAFESALRRTVPQHTIIRNQKFERVLPLSRSIVYAIKTVVNNKENNEGSQMVIYNQVDGIDVPLSSLEICTFKEESTSLPLVEILTEGENSCDCHTINHFKETATDWLSAERAHSIVSQIGVQCGEAFSLFEGMWFSPGKILAKLKIPPSVKKDLHKFVVHPSIIDACLQCTIFTTRTDQETSTVPMSYGQLILLPIKKKASHLYVMTDYQPDDPQKANLQLFTNVGEPLLLLKNVKSVDIKNLQPKLSLYESLFEFGCTEGTVAEVEKEEVANCRWIVVGLEGKKMHLSFKTAVEETMAVLPGEVFIVEEKNLVNPFSDGKRIVDSLLKVTAKDKRNIVVNFIPAYVQDLSVLDRDIEKAYQAMYFGCICGINELLDSDCRVVFVSSENVLTPYDQPDCIESDYKAACVWGFVKALRLENREKTLLCADVSRADHFQEFQNLIPFCVRSELETDIILRKDVCYFPRLQNVLSETCIESQDVPTSSMYKVRHTIHQDARGEFHSAAGYSFDTTTTSDVCPIRVEFASTIYGNIVGLAVKDESKVHLMPKQVFCYSGIMTDDQNADSHKRVLLFHAGHYMENVIHEDINQAIELPDGISSQQACVLSGPLSLACKTIEHVKSLSPSCQSCLVVGNSRESLITLSLVLSAKASGWDTCLLDEVYNDRITDIGVGFVSMYDLFIDADLGRGTLNLFDCVIFPSNLNELEVSILAARVRPGGVCLALKMEKESKKVTFVGATNLEGNKTLSVYDLASVSAVDLLQEWQTLSPLLVDSRYIWQLALQWEYSIIDPYSNLEIKHHAKVSPSLVMVNNSESERVRLERQFLSHKGLNQEKTYLVVGGHKGFGVDSVLWLVRMGAKHVVTCGRSPLPEQTGEKFSNAASMASATILHFCCDVTSKESMHTLQAQLVQLPPLGGILNSAVVYEDQLALLVDYQSFKRVLGPKVLGTINLYDLVCQLDVKLEFFVLYSSIAGTTGNYGQSSYAAANFFMNQFAAGMRKSTGQNFISICWGPLGDAGYLLDNQDVAMKIAKLGLNTIPTKLGLEWLETTLLRHSKYPVLVLNNFNWKAIGGKHNPFGGHPMLRHLLPPIEVGEEEGGDTSRYLMLLGKCKNKEEKYIVLANYVREWFAGWLGTAEPSEIDLNAPLSQYGLDSGGAITFQSRLEIDFQVTIGLYELLRPDSKCSSLIEKIMSSLDQSVVSLSVETSENDDVDQPDSDLTSSYLCSNKSQTGHEKDERDRDSETEYLDMADDFCALAYAPARPYANMFWIHSSHRYRGAMLTLANGFKDQDAFQIYSIGAPDIAYCADERESVRSLAKTYIRLIRKIQPRGPYFLGGYSFGGLVAYEMACIFTAKKDKVSMLTMLDTYGWLSDARPNTKYLITKYSGGDLDDIKLQMKTILKAVATSQLNLDVAVFERLLQEKKVEELISYFQNLANKEGKEIPNLEILSTSITKNRDMSIKAHFEWRPAKKLYRGPILFVEASDIPDGIVGKMTANAKSWRDLTGSKLFYTHRVKSNHLSLMDANVAPNLGTIVSTMARFVLRSQYPAMHAPEVSPIDRVSAHLLHKGLPALLGGKFKGVRGSLKVSMAKGRLKFRTEKRQVKAFGTKIVLPLQDIINIVKASEDSLRCQSLSTMGISVWTKNRTEVFFFEKWLDYIRVVNGLQSLFQMRLPLL